MALDFETIRKTPGLGMLALNAGAISALATFWKDLPNDYHAEFSAAFIAFALGIVIAVLSLYFQTLASHSPRPWKSYRHKQVRSLLLNRGLIVFIVSIVSLALLVLRRDAWKDWLGGWPYPLMLLCLVAAMLSAPFFERRARRRLVLGNLALGASCFSLAAFVGGMILTFGAWAVDKGRDPNMSPLSFSGSGTSSETVVSVQLRSGQMSAGAATESQTTPTPAPPPHEGVCPPPTTITRTVGVPVYIYRTRRETRRRECPIS